MGERLGLVLAGDVMTGRGVDQVLGHPGDPQLTERHVDDARTYVRLAERVSGPIPRPVAPTWPWGAALEVMASFGPALRIMNLETSVTRSDERAPDKAVLYRMNPDNLEVLSAADVDVWALANNHLLDHGVSGLLDTLGALSAAGLRATGAGTDADTASRPAIVDSGAGVRVLVASVADVSSGVPRSWAATRDRPGVALLPDLSDRTAVAVAARLTDDARPGDVRVVSIHWGANWGYDVPREQRRFAHRLVETGVHVVHGHSSHHPRPAEVHRGALVLYGCGDLVNDYEGIGGYESFRDDLRLLYLVSVDPAGGRVVSVHLVPLRARRLSLERPSSQDTRWLARVLDSAGRGLGTRVETAPDGILTLRHHDLR